MGMESLAYSPAVKYLCIILDIRLTFKEHVWQKCSKALRLLSAARLAIGKTWGTSIRTSKWLYEAVVRPMILYGSVVWAFRILRPFHPLVRVQRLMLLPLGSFVKSTPTAGLEVIFGPRPLCLLAQTEARMAAIRIQGRNPTSWDGVGGRKP